jgi:alkyldihydroxyacetonephosphate synthase
MKVAIEDVELLAGELRARLGTEAVLSHGDGLDAYEADTYWKAIAASANGSPLGRPDLVVLAASEEDVATVLLLANEHRVPVVPWGGGSGSQGGAVLSEGGIALDLTGLMLPHYPASVDLATVGGYVAARGSGVLSTRYGKIEDLLLALRVVLPTGEVVDTIPVPRHAVGPELTQLFVGSEGTLGVITRATLALRPLPAARRFEAVSFRSLPDGIAAVREAIARGFRPSVVRLYDETATRLTLSPVVGEELEDVCAVLCFEGEPSVTDAEAEGVLELAAAHGATILDGSLGQTWWTRRYEFYRPPHHPELPAMWGTIEAVATYARIYDVYQAVQRAIEPYERHGLTLRIHLSHWYPWGTMIYGRFVIPDAGPDGIELHDRIWEDGVRAILGAGGVINDHHGVGLKLSPYMRDQHGPALDTLRRIKEVLDPNRIMNPGKLDL